MRETVVFPAMIKSRLVSLIVLAVILSGCQGMSLNRGGGRVSEGNWIPLLETGKDSGSWNARELTVDYQYVRKGSELTLSGRVVYADLIKNSFVIIDYIHLNVLFLDAEGNVLESRAVMSSALDDPEEPERFGVSLTVPGGTRSMAFSFTGQARESGDRSGGASSSRFWHYPIH